MCSFYFLGFSIKAVPFPSAILNVKELGGTVYFLLCVLYVNYYNFV